MPASAVTLLLDHYRRHARRLPWRALPGAPRTEPYRVWLSEIMLQQTTVATVTPRFERFVERWPTVEALAAASDADVLSEWAGLGYYSRARNLIACARTVVAMGGFPRSERGLRALPGIGDYTAAAIAAIAFGEDSAPVDTNVERVVARLHALGDRKAIRAAAQALVPPGQAGDFAQAMMDLGATICRPKAPRCGECPLRLHCTSHMQGDPEAYPPTKEKVARPERFGVAWWVERDDAVWLVRRPDKGMLGGMAALPGPAWDADAVDPKAIATVRHVFTHFALTLSIVPRSDVPGNDGWWQPLGRIADAGLPTLYLKAAQAVLQRKTALAA